MSHMVIKGFLGIDVGTQGLSVIFTDEDLRVIATGCGSYEMVSGLEDGCYEQLPDDWEQALATAMSQLRRHLENSGQKPEILSIGIAGQMHGEVLVDSDDRVLAPARLWCDSRNEQEGEELTALLDFKMPKRITGARWLWTLRHRHSIAARVARITTPAGWISFRLTGHWNLGIGDASGMFPIDQATLNYDSARLNQFDQLAGKRNHRSLAALLPKPRTAGQDGGILDPVGSTLLGLPSGIPVAPAEGDQPAAMVGSRIGDAGMISSSFGTSVTANSIGDRAFVGVSPAVDHFCAADGRPINMVLLRNGTTFMNTVARMFAEPDDSSGKSFDELMQKAVAAAPGCNGLLALPFMDDEPGLAIRHGGMAALYGLNPSNADAGNAIKAALMATMFNLKIGIGVLDQQSLPRTKFILTGGLTRTPAFGQMLADIMQSPVEVPAGSDEGSAIGAALLAKYRYIVLQGSEVTWEQFLAAHRSADSRIFQPVSDNAEAYGDVYARYRDLLAATCF